MTSVSSSDSEVTGAPQDAINDFWESLITKKPAKVTKIFPSSLYSHLLPPKRKPGTSTGKNAAESYESAAAECRARVKRAVRECHRVNEKFTDPEFNIEYLGNKNCLQGLKYWFDEKIGSTGSSVGPDQLGSALSTLAEAGVLQQNAATFNIALTSRVLTNADSDNSYEPSPGSVHRVDWIFDKPQFEIDGFGSSDVIQGYNGDCW